MIKKIKLILTLLLLQGVVSYAQKTSAALYKGTLDNMPVTFYIKRIGNECGAPDMFMAMYKYDKKGRWIQLDLATNEKSNWCMTEIGFTGVMILKSAEKTMDGVWISPDGKKQLKVTLKEQPLLQTEERKMEDKLEEVNHENFDC